MMDTSYDMVKLCRDTEKDISDGIETSFLVGDEEFLPIKEKYVEDRHNVNDLVFFGPS